MKTSLKKNNFRHNPGISINHLVLFVLEVLGFIRDHYVWFPLLLCIFSVPHKIHDLPCSLSLCDLTQLTFLPSGFLLFEINESSSKREGEQSEFSWRRPYWVFARSWLHPFMGTSFGQIFYPQSTPVLPWFCLLPLQRMGTHGRSIYDPVWELEHWHISCAFLYPVFHKTLFP